MSVLQKHKANAFKIKKPLNLCTAKTFIKSVEKTAEQVEKCKGECVAFQKVIIDCS